MGEQSDPNTQAGEEAKKKSREELEAEFKDQLKSNLRYESFFDEYTSSSVEAFTEYFSKYKCDLLEHGKQSYHAEEAALESKDEEAARYFWEIQERKLFEIQCRWRAGLIDIPQVETVWDFDYWGSVIQICPFVPPVTHDEFNLYHDYVLSDEFEETWLYYGHWQDYERLKEWSDEDDERSEFPPWYKYYERFTGKTDWRLLPDIRGERDMEYFHLALDIRPSAGPARPVDNRAYLRCYDEEVLEDFIKRCESPELLRYFLAWQKKRDIEEDDDLEEAVERLRYSEERVPMEYNPDWREAIFAAARRVVQLEVSKGCERVYEDYLRRVQLGLSHELLISEDHLKQAEQFRDHWRKMVKKGKSRNESKTDQNLPG